MATSNIFQLSLYGNYASQILSAYLWRNPTAPNPADLADSKYTELGSGVTVEFSAQEYMDKIGTGFVKAHPFGIFKRFFDAKHEDKSNIQFDITGLQPNAKGEYELTHDNLVNQLYIKGSDNYNAIDKQPQMDLKHYYWDIDSSDYAERAFTFGSSKLTFDEDNIRYIVDKDGNPLRIENLEISPMDEYKIRDKHYNDIGEAKENFDFESTDGLAKLANPVLSPMMDPSGIGKTVTIEFTDDVAAITLTKQQFYEDLAANTAAVKQYNELDEHLLDMLLPSDAIKLAREKIQNQFKITLGKIRDSGVFDFLTDEGKPVVYGTDQDDKIKGPYAPNNNMNDEDLGGLLHNWFLNDALQKNYIHDYIENGIVYVAGKGIDRIGGSQYDDKVYGNDGEDKLHGGRGDDYLYGGDDEEGLNDVNSDKLFGEDGNDHLYGGAGDDILKGGNDDDTLNGGIGLDTYIFTGKWGSDKIIDSDKDGIIQIDGQNITSPTVKISDTLWKDPAQGLLFHKIENGSKTQLHIISQETNDSIFITDWQAGGFGIELKNDTSNKYALQLGDQHSETYEENGETYVHWSENGRGSSPGVKWNYDTGKLEGGVEEKGFDDVMYGLGDGDNKNDELHGLGGDDYLTGREGDDKLYGGDGTDLLVGGLGSNQLYGGEGDDVIAVSGQLNVIFRHHIGERHSDRNQLDDIYEYVLNGSTWAIMRLKITDGQGMSPALEMSLNERHVDHIPFNESGWTYGKNADTINFADGGNGNDYICGSLNMDFLTGGSGSDYILGHLGNDILSGGHGDDFIEGDTLSETAHYTMVPGSRQYQYATYAEHGNDYLNGGEGDDIIFGNGGDDIISGGAGADEINGDGYFNVAKDIGGIDKIYGGEGADKINGGGQDDTIYGDEGDDIIFGDSWVSKDILDKNYHGNDKIYGGKGNDQISGQGGDDLIVGGSGDDSLQGGEGEDTLKGGEGKDTLAGGEAKDTLTGGLGNDILQGGKGADTLKGGLGNDTLAGGEGKDTLTGSLGDDTLQGGEGEDTLKGGEGFDTYAFIGQELDAADRIIDSGGKGHVTVDGQSWAGRKWTETAKDSQIWKDNEGNTLTLDSGQLTLKTADGKTVAVIEGFTNGDLGFEFTQANNAPEAVGTFAEQELTVNTAWSLAAAAYFTDTDGDTLTYSATLADGSALPSWLSIDSATGALSGTPDTAGDINLIITAIDPAGETATQTLLLGIAAANQAPEAGDSLAEQNTTVGQAWSYALPAGSFADADGDTLTYSATLADGSALPNWLTIESATGALSGTPDTAGNVNVVITAADPAGETATQTLSLSIVTPEIIQVNGQYSGGNGDNIAQGNDQADTLYGQGGNDQLSGGANNDLLNGGSGNDILNGESGDDTLDGEAGNDVLTGGTGNDVLNGGKGDDTYIFAKGFGKDIINNYDRDKDAQDIIKFTDGLKQSDLTFTLSGNHLVITATAGEDRLTIRNYFDESGNNQIDAITFSDGETLDTKAVTAMFQQATEQDDMLFADADGSQINGLGGNDIISGASGSDTLSGDDGDDRLYGSSGADTLSGGADNDQLKGGSGNDMLNGDSGDDSLHGDAGDDSLNGGAGYDILNGGAGDDVLTGGTGDDTLSGSEGSDTYIFGKNFGQDTIYNNDSTEGHQDIIQFIDGWKQSDFTFRRSSDDLAIIAKATEDTVFVKDYFENSNRGKVQQITFSDGNTIDITAVKALVQQATEVSDILYAYDSGSEIQGLGGNDTIYGASGSDTLSGDDGNDHLYGKSGDDYLDGGAGNDYLYGETGNDTLNGGDGRDELRGGAGDDVLTGGTGDDTLSGDQGSDSYIFGKNFGQDSIDNRDGSQEDQDIIQFTADWQPSDFIYQRSGDDLIISAKVTNDEIKVIGHFVNNQHIDQIVFAGGDVLTVEDIDTLLLQTSEGDDTIQIYGDQGQHVKGLGGNDTLIGGAGDDILEGNDGDDELTGNAGDDKLMGGPGDDSLDGGAGADTLDGGVGNNTYIIDRTDTIIIHPESHSNTIVTANEQYDDLIINLNLNSDEFSFTRQDFTDTVSEGDHSLFDKDTIVAAGKEHGNVKLSRIIDKLIDTAYSLEAGEHKSFGMGSVFVGPGFMLDNYPIELYGPKTDKYHIGENKDQFFLHFDGDSTFSIRLKDDVNRDMLLKLSDGKTLNFKDGIENISNIKNIQLAFNDGKLISLAEILQSELDKSYSDGEDLIHGFRADDYLFGGTGNDILQGLSGNDTIEGGKGDDILVGDSYSLYWRNNPDYSTLTAAANNDDTYLFSIGDGADHIYDASGVDKIVFKSEEITPDNIRITRDSGSITLTRYEEGSATGDSIQIHNFYNDQNAIGKGAVESITFTDGTIWTPDDIKAILQTGSVYADTLYGDNNNNVLNGLTGDDKLYGFEGNDTLSGDDGSDVLYAGAGTDTLYGGSGGDKLYGGDGDDILNGGTGDDLLDAGAGHNTFVFSEMWGNDSIKGYSKNNTIIFEEANPSDIVIRKSGISTVDGKNKISIDYFLSYNTTNHAFEPSLVNEVIFADGTVWDMAKIIEMATQSSERDDIIDALTPNDIIHGGLGNDKLSGQKETYGEEGDDKIRGSGILDGGSGNDTLSGKGELYGGDGSDQLKLTGSGIVDGGAGDDILDARESATMPFGDDGSGMQVPVKGDSVNTLRGGKGDDTIYGSYANDAYEFNLGDGHDTIIETTTDKAYSNVMASYDVIRFGAGISVNDIEIIQSGDDLLLKHHNGQDSITVENHFSAYYGDIQHFKINEITFADGTSLSLTDIDGLSSQHGSDLGEQLLGSSGNDSIYAGGGDDNIFARSGDDVVYGESGKDYIDGEDGNDKLFGGSGDDSLRGSLGDDILDGGLGNDHYVYRPGDGQDVIDQSGGGEDILFFIDGIDKDRLSFTKEGDDLLVNVDNDTNQSVRVKDHFLGGDKAISMVQPDGGYGITAEQINQLLGVSPDNDNNGNDNNGNDNNGGGDNDGQDSTTPNLIGTDGNDTLHGTAAAETLQGKLGDDTYIYSGGKDTLIDSGGIDKVSFGAGISFNDVGQHLVKSGNDFIIRVKGDANNDLRIPDFFSDGNKVIESFELDSGQVITAEQIFAAFGVSAPDSNTNDNNGNDNNGGGNNGGQDSTTPNLMGTDGNDTLRGTAAAETLQGKLGDDTYIYSGGKDTLIDSGGIDKVSFGAGISFNDVGQHLVKSGNDFIIRVKGDANNDLRIPDFFSDGNKVIESFELDSGQVITAEQIFAAFGQAAPEARSLSRKAFAGDYQNSSFADNGQAIGSNPLDKMAKQSSALMPDESNNSPELVTPFADVTVEQDKAFAIKLPLDNFRDPDGDRLTYTVTQDDDSPLPDWLHVDIPAGRMTGTVPTDSSDVISIKITAKDPSGLTIYDYFDLDVKETAITNNTPWLGGLLNGGSGDDTLSGSGDDTLNGSGFGDTLNGNDGDDSLDGGFGRDILNGGKGNDSLNGGKGNDSLNGGHGSDLYIYDAGDGQDTISDSGGIADILALHDLKLSDLLLDTDGDDWILSVTGSDDQITIKDAESDGRIETIQVGEESYSYDEFSNALSPDDEVSSLQSQAYIL